MSPRVLIESFVTRNDLGVREKGHFAKSPDDPTCSTMGMGPAKFSFFVCQSQTALCEKSHRLYAQTGFEQYKWYGIAEVIAKQWSQRLSGGVDLPCPLLHIDCMLTAQLFHLVCFTIRKAR